MTSSRRNAVLAIVAGSLLMTAAPAKNPPAPDLAVSIPPVGPAISLGPDIPADIPHSSDHAFADLLAAAESSRDPLQMNKGGYAGLFQLGESAAAIAGIYDPGEPLTAEDTRNRWRGTFHIPGYPGVRSIGDFLDTPAAQVAAFRLHLAHLDREIAQRGLDRRIGGYVAGVPITWDGLRAMMHLGGPDGTERFLATAGVYDPADDNGVRISDYGRRFAGVTAIEPTRPAVIPTVATTVAAPAPAGPASPAVVTPTLVATTPSPRRRPAKRRRGARGRPLPNNGSETVRISAWRTGSCGGRRPCRTSCARPRAGRG
ncbi:hypothetical protein [Inquilinus sp. Marseille-Q2685]|uniref:hypothetical protein n=1 Tax=Inquilinus sp. Marseille-Q2685 TaxID=2866581 RepID=UPI001CE3C085|nr:hypothetical protein [Inquilinus sp. Marseille-Q2685]